MLFYLEVLVVIIVLLVILIKGIPAAISMIVRVVKGSYSAAYVFTYRKSFGKNPYPHAVRDEIAQHLTPFSEAANLKHPTFSTPTEIKFDQLDFGISFQAITETYGNPLGYTIQQYDDWLLVAASYAIGKGDQRIRKIFFFINNRLIAGELIYPSLDTDKTGKIQQQLTEKYGIHLKSGDIFKFCITDKNNDKLIYDATGFNLILRYGCTPDPELQKILNTFTQPTNNTDPTPPLKEITTL